MGIEFSYDHEYWLNQSKKYLFARLDSVWIAGFPGPGDLSEFIAMLSAASGQDLAWIAYLHHLTRANGAFDYVTRELPDSMRQLSRASQPLVNCDSRCPRGKVMWSRTMREQAVRADPGHFVVASMNRTHDLPENRLLKSYLRQMAHPRLPLRQEASESPRTGNRVAATLAGASDVLRSSYLTELPLPPSVTPVMLARAARSKKRLYWRLCELWQEFEAAVEMGDLAGVKNLLEQGWLAPGGSEDTDSLFELYVLLCAIEAMEKVCIPPGTKGNIQYCVVRPGGSASIAVFHGPEWIGEVCFDRAPDDGFSGVSPGSLYRSILSEYSGVKSSSRRPDLVIRLRRSGTSDQGLCLLAEAKNTPADSEYMSDSVYKVLGYLKDYEALWPHSTQRPKAVLAIPNGIRPRYESKWLEQDVALVSGNIEAAFVRVLGHVVSTERHQATESLLSNSATARNVDSV